MSNIDIIRAWKDEEYRNSLTEEQRSQLPENPAGMVELSDEDMEALAGGYLTTVGLQPGGQGPVLSKYFTQGCSKCLSYKCGSTPDLLRPSPPIGNFPIRW